MSGYIRTMRDLEAATYGGNAPFGSAIGNDILKGAGAVIGLHGATHGSGNTALSGTASTNLTSLYNKIYGQKVWSMINQEINALSILPKRPYTQSGWRVMTNRPIGGSSAAFGIGTTSYSAGSALDAPNADELGGVDENHSLDSTGLQSVAPEYTTLYMTPKIVAHQFDYSELAAEMAKIDDGIGDLRALVREDMGKLHAEVQSFMCVMGLENYDKLSGGASTVTATGSDSEYPNIHRNYTSLNKIVSSSAELVALCDSSILETQASQATLPLPIVQLYGGTNRQLASAGTATASFMDAYVNYGGTTTSYTSGNVRSLSLSLLNTTVQNLRTNGGTPRVILTGYDTIQAIADLLQSQERFLESKEIMPSHNGVKGVEGREVGFRVATYFDTPLIPSKDMPKTGAGATLSDMLFLDTEHIWMSVLKPTQYFEDGINHGNPFGVGVLGNKGLFRTIGELGCSFFKGQGKITNLK